MRQASKKTGTSKRDEIQASRTAVQAAYDAMKKHVRKAASAFVLSKGGGCDIAVSGAGWREFWKDELAGGLATLYPRNSGVFRRKYKLLYDAWKTASQLSMIAANGLALQKQKKLAKERMAAGGGDKRSDAAKQKSGVETVPPPVSQGKARDNAGAAVGVDGKQVDLAAAKIRF